MEGSVINDRTLEELNARYSRESKNICFDLMLNTTFVNVGLGASGPMIEQFAKLGIKSFYLFDNDIVETKNLPSQSYKNKDVGVKKAEATKKILEDCEFEKGNANLPSLEIFTYGDFLEISDDEMENIIKCNREKRREIIFIITTDYHPADARASRIALRFEVPTFWVSLYRMGMAGEIIFYLPGHDLPCYRCITETRYNFFDKNRLLNHLKKDFSGSGKSMGLPMAATIVDSILAHLVVGYIHRNIKENQHGSLFRKIIHEKRNFIQCQLDPEYMLNDNEDIFSGIQAPDLIAFNTLFQQENEKQNCLDCRKFSNSWVWKDTDYTKENYRNVLETFSMWQAGLSSESGYVHPLLYKYKNLFPQWDKYLDDFSLDGKKRFKLIIERDGIVVDSIIMTNLDDIKHINNIIPGLYSINIDNDQIIWCGEFTEQHLIWNSAFPERPVELAADTGNSKTESTLELNLLNGQITILILPGIESGCLQIKTGELDLE
jgi:hypothetical protein